jgi:hypothetical protein
MSVLDASQNQLVGAALLQLSSMGLYHVFVCSVLPSTSLLQPSSGLNHVGCYVIQQLSTCSVCSTDVLCGGRTPANALRSAPLMLPCMLLWSTCTHVVQGDGFLSTLSRSTLLREADVLTVLDLSENDIGDNGAAALAATLAAAGEIDPSTCSMLSALTGSIDVVVLLMSNPFYM